VFIDIEFNAVGRFWRQSIDQIKNKTANSVPHPSDRLRSAGELARPLPAISEHGTEGLRPADRHKAVGCSSSGWS